MVNSISVTDVECRPELIGNL